LFDTENIADGDKDSEKISTSA